MPSQYQLKAALKASAALAVCALVAPPALLAQTTSSCPSAQLTSFTCQASDNAAESSAWDIATWLYRSQDPSEYNPTGMTGVPPTSSSPPPPVGGALAADQRRLVLFGDLMLTNDEELPFVHPELQALMASADLVVGNMEGPVYRGPLDLGASQFFDFHGSTGYVRSFFSQFCVDPERMVFTVANNHAADKGRWPETLQALVAVESPAVPPSTGACDAATVRGVVGGPVQSSQDVDVFDLDGVRVGVVGWTHLENCEPDSSWVDHKQVWRTPAQVGIRKDWLGFFHVDQDWNAVKQARDIDVLVGAVHWDRQFYYFPAWTTQLLGRSLLRQGFDVIAGDDPHVLQPAQVLDEGMVLHSLSGLNINFGLTSRTTLVPVVEVIVNSAGDVVSYKVHAFAQRRAASGTTLPSTNTCYFKADGGIATSMPDVGRATASEIVPLSEISNAWGVRGRLQDELDLVFPTR